MTTALVLGGGVTGDRLGALFFHAIRSAEMVEGMTSFLEQRPPVWPRGGAGG